MRCNSFPLGSRRMKASSSKAATRRRLLDRGRCHRGLHAPEAAAKLQAAVGLDVIVGDACAIHFGDDEPAVIRRDRYAVGNPQSFGDDARSAIRYHQNDAAESAAIGRRRHIKTEIANIGAALPIDDHVVDGAFRDPRQFGIRRKLAVGVRHQALAKHRQDDERPSGSTPGRRAFVLDFACCSRSPRGRR